MECVKGQWHTGEVLWCEETAGVVRDTHGEKFYVEVSLFQDCTLKSKEKIKFTVSNYNKFIQVAAIQKDGMLYTMCEEPITIE